MDADSSPAALTNDGRDRAAAVTSQGYLNELLPAVRAEVRKILAWTVPAQTDALPGAVEPGRASDGALGSPPHWVRLSDGRIPAIVARVSTDGRLHVEAKGRVLEVGLDENIYHYSPDGKNPQEHAEWIVELWSEESR